MKGTTIGVPISLEKLFIYRIWELHYIEKLGGPSLSKLP